MYVIKLENSDVEDIFRIQPLIKEFAKEFPLEDAAKHYHPKAGTNILRACMLQGALFVAKEGDDILGVIGGIIQVNPFTLATAEFREVCWYVDEEHRNGRVALKLYNRFVDYAQWLINNDEVQAAYMTTIISTPESAKKLIKRKFKEVETNYIMQGKTQEHDNADG